MASWYDPIVSGLTSLIPLDKWIRAVGNVLKGLSFAFVLVVIIVLALIFNDWGFSSTQRVGLIVLFAAVLVGVIVVVILLAMRADDPLYNPYERSLRGGKRFGTEKLPRQRDEALNLPSQGGQPGLEPPGSQKKLPPGGPQ